MQFADAISADSSDPMNITVCRIVYTFALFFFILSFMRSFKIGFV